jgi:uncharacterized protein YlaI
MKRLLVILTLASCETQDPNAVQSQQLGNRIINTYVIDGCEYIGELGGDNRNDILAHKGNCKNPVHERPTKETNSRSHE